MAGFAGAGTKRDRFNFKLGQTWVRRDEMPVTVVKLSTNSVHVALAHGRPYEVDLYGRVSEAMLNAADVVQYDASKTAAPQVQESEARRPIMTSRFYQDAEGENLVLGAGDPVGRVETTFDPHVMTELAAAAPTKDSNPKEAIGDKKVPMWLCSAIAKAHWAAAQFAGLMKYGAWNWRVAGVRTSTYISAMLRHIDRYANGERLDPVDGTHHLGNIMACAAILLEAEYLKKLNDDRSPQADLGDAFAEVEAIMARLKVQYADKNPHHHTILDEAAL